ncbi:hypothetical protein MKK58_09380 [Methylobacterium sp. J-078]|uniref:hypothetical protein n=1 Tax=Methylobacterium sp. J-078 TaxID=2836657 RepID=UPI001FBB70B7|nr:hypothetical protein [Methylobacterium sp. J-078]MCJ2044737.1 hypothetical protein [Methylobacterium sp. J-078]
MTRDQAEKLEAEKMIRHLCKIWAVEEKISIPSEAYHNFLTFKLWLEKRGYAHFLHCRSTGTIEQTASIWFNEELKQA